MVFTQQDCVFKKQLKNMEGAQTFLLHGIGLPWRRFSPLHDETTTFWYWLLLIGSHKQMNESKIKKKKHFCHVYKNFEQKIYSKYFVSKWNFSWLT